MRLLMAVYPLWSLWCSMNTVDAVDIVDCRDVVATSCTDFCLSSMENHMKLDWHDDACEQDPCDIAALADEALWPMPPLPPVLTSNTLYFAAIASMPCPTSVNAMATSAARYTTASTA